MIFSPFDLMCGELFRRSLTRAYFFEKFDQEK